MPFCLSSIYIAALEVLKIMARDPNVADFILCNDGVATVVQAMSQWSRSADVIKTVRRLLLISVGSNRRAVARQF